MSIQSDYHVNPVQMENELEQIKSAQSNPQRFNVLYDRYHESIFRFVYQRLNDQEMAYDLTSQVFLKAMLNLNKYAFQGVPFSAWLFRIARNELVDLFRKNQALRTLNIETIQVQNIMDEVLDYESEENHQLLIEAIASLPEEDLQMIEMRYFEKMHFKEIAEIFAITENNAKLKSFRIIQKLKDKFDKTKKS